MNARPRTLDHDVCPSLPMGRTLRMRHVCSSSHGITAWLIGMNLSMRDSRQSLSVRNMPRTSCTPTSVPPLDCESYFGGFSVEMLSMSTHLSLISSKLCMTRVLSAGSLSALMMSLVWPSHSTSRVTNSATNRSSPAPLYGTTWAKRFLLFVHLTMMHLTMLPALRSSSRAALPASSSVWSSSLRNFTPPAVM